MVFPLVMCESWTIKKAECWRTDIFELWCWRRLLSPLDIKEIKSVNPKEKQPWIFIGSTDAEAEASILWPPDMKNWLIRKDPDAGRIKGNRRRGRQRMRWLNGITTWWTWVWARTESWWRTGKPGMLKSLGSQRVRHNWATGLNWFGMDMYTLLYLKWLAKKYILYSTWNADQYYVTDWMGAGFGGECMTESPRCPLKTITTL